MSAAARYRRELGGRVRPRPAAGPAGVAAPRFFGAGQPARPAGGQRARPGGRRRHDARHPGPPDRHLDRVAVRDLRGGRGPARQDGARRCRWSRLGVVAAGRAAGRAQRRAGGGPRAALHRGDAGDDGDPARGPALGDRRRRGCRTCPAASSGSGSVRRAAAWPSWPPPLVVFAAFAWGLRHARRRPRRLRHRLRRGGGAARRASARGAWCSACSSFMGALTGLAAAADRRSSSSTSRPTPASGLELKVIAAVVVGGVAISGGRGTLVGTLLGVALLGTIGPALTFLGTEAHWERALQGLVILLAVARTRCRRSRGAVVPAPEALAPVARARAGAAASTPTSAAPGPGRRRDRVLRATSDRTSSPPATRPRWRAPASRSACSRSP